MKNNASFFIDEPKIGSPFLDFPNYITAISDLILHSRPMFTMGIFGDWGTGKTTLMKNIENTLKLKHCNCVEFNAWRYSHENRHATFPLMLTIISRLLENEEVLRSLEDSSSTKVKKTLIQILKALKVSINFKTPVVDAGIEINPTDTISDETDDISVLVEKSKSPVQEGIELIKELVKRVKEQTENPALKLVVFIDDLDRCTPEKALEVFESVKIFFDMEGIVFVFGLSQEIVEEAINYKYQHLKGSFDGKSYLKKIIQVPVVLPAWQENNIIDFITKLLEENKDSTYAKFFEENKSLISQAVDSNPREVKRLLNNFILAYQIHRHNSVIDKSKLLAVQALTLRWKKYYESISHNPKLLHQTKDTTPKRVLKSTLGFNSSKSETKWDKLFEDHGGDEKLRTFLRHEGSIIYEISDDEWPVYRRAVIVEPELKMLKKIKTEYEAEEPLIGFSPYANFNNLEKVDDPIKFFEGDGTKNVGQLANVLSKTVTLQIKSKDGSAYFRYMVPKASEKGQSLHCSDVKIHVLLDDEEIGTSDWLGYQDRNPALPLETPVYEISNIPKGNHKFTLFPEGRIGGCNQGYIGSWGGIIQFYK